MTLSAPSLLAAASSAGSPPRAWALVAEAAETPLLPLAELELDEEGGEQAATAARLAVTAAREATDAPRRRIERVGRMGTFLLRASVRAVRSEDIRSRTSTTPTSARHRPRGNDLNTG